MTNTAPGEKVDLPTFCKIEFPESYTGWAIVRFGVKPLKIIKDHNGIYFTVKIKKDGFFYTSTTKKELFSIDPGDAYYRGLYKKSFYWYNNNEEIKFDEADYKSTTKSEFYDMLCLNTEFYFLKKVGEENIDTRYKLDTLIMKYCNYKDSFPQQK